MVERIPEPEIIRPTMRSNVEPTTRTLEERLTDLERQVNMGKERVETYTKEKPLMALGIAFIAGYLIGKLVG